MIDLGHVGALKKKKKNFFKYLLKKVKYASRRARWGSRHGNRLLSSGTMVRHPSRINPETLRIEEAVIAKQKNMAAA